MSGPENASIANPIFTPDLRRPSSNPSDQPEWAYQYRNWFTLGILEMSVLHRLRNQFMSMMGNLSFIREEIEKGGSPQSYLDDLEKTLQEACDFSKIVQRYSEKQKPNFSQIDLNTSIQECLAILQKGALPSLEMEFIPDKSIPSILADPFMIKLALWEWIGQYLSFPGVPNENTPSPQPVRLKIQTGTVERPLASVLQSRFEKQIELLINASPSAVRAPVSPSQNKGYVPHTMEHPSYEIVKSILRVHGGEVSPIYQEDATEKIHFYFSIKSVSC